jgi:Raf kinase inhibitor-like YbhB/YbcL family protein
MAEEAGEMVLSIKGISSGGKIPRKYTQDGQGAVKDVSPPVEWYEVPEGTVSLAIIMEDPDSPDPADPSPNSFVHWVVANIPPTLKGLPEGFTVKDHVTDDDEASEILEGVNDFKSTGYRGPVPSDSEHRYELHLYALDTKLRIPKKPSRDRLLEAMDGHILAEALLVTTYGVENAQTGHNRFLPAGLANLSGPGRPNTKGNSNAMGQIHGR